MVGVLDEDMDVCIDGANIESIERRQASESPPARTSQRPDEKWIAVSAVLRNGEKKQLWLPHSLESCSRPACDDLRSLERLQFLDPSVAEYRVRPPATVKAKTETTSGRAMTLTAARLSPSGSLEMGTDEQVSLGGEQRYSPAEVSVAAWTERRLPARARRFITRAKRTACSERRPATI